ncbi:PAS domain-containing protein [Sphingomonas sp. Y38-1Y]|uniref:PAS domain-containing protein n=1 Tax=Sphingomonas sp. Y38-1Y TaxID=3078265 RepID=UPI0028EEFDF0|nr:PAS domain-containing protein [Sphingomonas sp. Y38-1Y]
MNGSAAILIDALDRRPARAADHAVEARMLSSLAHDLAEQPDHVLERLTQCMVDAGIAGSAGISLLEGDRFVWEALSGQWAGYRGGTMPRDASPCGRVLDHDAPLFLIDPQSTYAGPVLDPPAAEMLLVPFHLEGRPVGTLWGIAHDGDRCFDREDLRLLESLSQFAASAFLIRQRSRELQRSRDLLQGTMDASTDMIQVFEAVRDEGGAIVDFRWLLNNHTSESRYGEVRGESLLERNPGVVVEGIFDTFKRVTETGEPSVRERHYVHEQFDGWFLQSVVKLGDGIATTTKEIGDWKRAQAEVLRLRDEIANDRLQESEARLRRFGEASRDVLWIRDAGTLQWEYLTPAFEAIYGLPVARAIATPGIDRWIDRIMPADRDQARAVIARAQRGESDSFEYQIHRPDGEARWLRSTVFPIRGNDGAVQRIGGIDQDITGIKEAQHRLEESEERLRSAMEVGRLGLWDWNIRSGRISWSDEHFRMEGYAVGEVEPSYEAWLAGVHPEDRTETEMALLGAMARHEEYAREFRSLHPDGSVRWLSARGRFTYGEDGKPERMVGAMVDLTERREAEERQRLLLGELQHRVRNILAVVRSMVRRTHEADQSAEEFVQHLEGRLGALARTQVLLTRAVDAGADLELLVRDELAAQAADFDRIDLIGARVLLPPKAAEVLTLAVHELATNALKYGVFARESGRLRIEWRVVSQAEERRLELDWRETGLDLDTRMAPREGFGTELITRRVPYELRGAGSLTIEPEGVHCRLDVPLDPRSSMLESNGGRHGS